MIVLNALLFVACLKLCVILEGTSYCEDMNSSSYLNPYIPTRWGTFFEIALITTIN